MRRRYTATVTVDGIWCDGDLSSEDATQVMQEILDTAFEYIDGQSARVVDTATVAEVED